MICEIRENFPPRKKPAIQYTEVLKCTCYENVNNLFLPATTKAEEHWSLFGTCQKNLLQVTTVVCIMPSATILSYSSQTDSTNSLISKYFYKWDPCECKSNATVGLLLCQQISSIQFGCCQCSQLFSLPSLWYAAPEQSWTTFILLAL